MVDVAPFRALRFSPEKGNDISKYICPPYDVISPHEREELGKKFPQNVIHLELPAGDGDAKYANAAHLLSEWRGDALLLEDRKSSFYLLETTYKIDDPFAPKGQLKRYGVLTALRLEAPGRGHVHPHEKTLPKAKEDRLKLITALRTNISPIFGLFFDDQKKWPAWIGKIIKEKPLTVGKEHAALSHRMWKIHDPKVQGELRRLLGSKELYIADGHHRYEVSWAYNEGRLKEDPNAKMTAGSRRVMAYICPMEEKGLLMLPTHRLVKSNRSLDEWRTHLEQAFEIRKAKDMNAILAALKPEGSRKIGWVTANGHFLLSLRPDISLDRCLQHRPKALRELDVVLLHDLALGEASDSHFLAEKEIVFTRDVKGIETLTKKDRAWVGFMLGSPGVGSLARVAGAGEVMPPKTTYFYPKVPTGFTLMPLDQSIE
ncbi:MAG: DUF1015 domain-containing protein [Elusimicrobia bacterium]|nr:DUF1015 domain-containing protein [Elusimicrobiota bacterium]